VSIARAGASSAIGTAARLLAALATIKLVAHAAGPEGVGRLGQFLGLMALLSVLAGGGIGAGIVKHVAEYRNDPERFERLVRTALGYALCASLATGALALAFARPLALWLLGDARYVGLVCVLALAQAGIAMGNCLLAIFNGLMDVRRLVLVQVTGSALSVALALLLSWRFGLYGALLSLVLGQLLWLPIGLPAWRTSPHYRPGLLRPRLDREMAARLAGFSAMTLSSALCAPLVGIAARDHLAAQLGWTQVGYWQAVGKVSDAYLLFLTAAINVHYLPRLSAIGERDALRRELTQASRQLIPAAAALALAIYLAREWITPLLFSAQFAPINALYAPQLLGDVIKIASFVFSYLMLAKAMTGLFVASEFAFAGLYFTLLVVLTRWFGLPGAVYAFAANYSLYLVFNLWMARRYLGRMP